jgi:hypothetical protein
MEQEQTPDLLSPEDAPDPNDKLSTELQVLSFCIPIAGAIIYFSNQSKYPQKARTACHMALWGIAVGVILQVIVYMARSGR